MNKKEQLALMGISGWQLRKPYHVTSSRCVNTLELPAGCQLLFVAQAAPTLAQKSLFSSILQSVSLTFEQAFYLPELDLAKVSFVNAPPQWLWFCGDPYDTADAASLTALAKSQGSRVLISVSLAKLETQRSAKQNLWQQIKQYAVS
ncbi:MAG: DNA polymerase III subunit psi [Vibrionaceae bacterium]